MWSTTFGYDAGQDRVWLTFNDGLPRVWLTRRLMASLLGPGMRAMEASTPGGEGGASAATRADLEHALAMNELLPGEERLPLRVDHHPPGAFDEVPGELCTSLSMNFSPQRCEIVLHCSASTRKLSLERVPLHRWLFAMVRVVQEAGWNLQDMPPWLSRSLLPAAVRSLVEGPRLPGLDEETDEGPGPAGTKDAGDDAGAGTGEPPPTGPTPRQP